MFLIYHYTISTDVMSYTVKIKSKLKYPQNRKGKDEQ